MDLASQVLTSLELQQDRFVYPVSLRGISVNLTVLDHVSELRLPVVLSSHGHEMPNPSETWTFRLWRHKISTSKKNVIKIYRKGGLYTFWGPTQLLLHSDIHVTMPDHSYDQLVKQTCHLSFCQMSTFTV